MEFKKQTLPNGLRVVLVPKPDSVAATILVMVETGSIYEDKVNNGVAHFLEHMCFKGTTKRPTPAMISEELDGLGAQYNAFTDTEYTGYYATVQPAKFAQALDILADMYLDPTLPEAEIAKEKGVVVEEINMYEDLPKRKVAMVMQELLYGDQPAGRSILGTKDTLTGLTRSMIADFRDKYYTAPRTAVIIAGKFDEAQVLDLVGQYFGQLSATEAVGRQQVLENQTAPAFKFIDKKSDQTHLVVSFRGVPLGHPDYYPHQLLAAVLGGGMSSRLFKKVRDELGAAYYVGAYNDAATDHGAFSIFCGAGHAKALTVIEAVVAECQNLKTELVSDQELTRVKDNIIGNLLISLETSQQLASYFGGDEVLRQPLNTPAEEVLKYQAVTSADLLRVAAALFVPAKTNLAIVGPVADQSAFEKALVL